MHTVAEKLSPPYNPPSLVALTLRPCSVLAAAKIPFVIWDSHHLRFTPTLLVPVALSAQLQLVVPAASLSQASKAILDALPEFTEVDTTKENRTYKMLRLNYGICHPLLQAIAIISSDELCYDGRRELHRGNGLPEGFWVPTLSGFVDSLISMERKLDLEDSISESTASERDEAGKQHNLRRRKEVNAAIGYLQNYIFAGLKVSSLELLPDNIMAFVNGLKVENRPAFCAWFIGEYTIPDREESYCKNADGKKAGTRWGQRNRNRYRKTGWKKLSEEESEDLRLERRKLPSDVSY